MNERLLRQLGIEEEAMALDATGFPLTNASQHYLSRAGRTCQRYMKGFYMVGVESQLITAWREDWAPNSDMHFLNRMRRAAHPFGRRRGKRRFWILLADRAFDGKQARPTDLIVPRRGQRRVVRADRRQRADLTDQARLDGFLGQRWKCETVFSVIKRISGDTIRSRRRSHQRREVAIKGLVYNLHR